MATLLSYALVTLADVKESLGIDSGNTSRDNLIIRKINQATEMIEGFCSLPVDHHFKQTTYTDELYDATQTNAITLRMRPVSSVSVSQRDNTLNEDSFTVIDTENYFVDSTSGVIDTSFGLSGSVNGYRVTYTAGYSTIPADLSEACVMLASFLVENSSSGGAAIKSKQEGQRKIEYFQSDTGTDSLIEQLGIDDMIQRYRRYPLTDNV